MSAIRGKPEVVRLSLVCLLARGHLLIEDVPGVGKTTLAQALARAVACRFHRCNSPATCCPATCSASPSTTPVGGFRVQARPHLHQFSAGRRNQPHHSQDAIRAARSHERSQVTIDGHPHSLPRPFMVIATQNPVEHHGTYPLPESQLDRFLMRLRIGYPDAASEREIVRHSGARCPNPARAAWWRKTSCSCRTRRSGVWWKTRWSITCSPSSSRPASRIAGAGRQPARLAGAVSRGAGAGLVEGRDYAIPDDVKRLAVPVFAHRVVINTRNTLVERRADAGERIIEEISARWKFPCRDTPL
jgi:MoxR-like ATPase